MIVSNIERVTLADVGIKIGKKDLRSIRKWCNMNDVDIIRDGRNSFVIQTEFEFALDKNIIKHFNEKYGEQGNEIYLLHREKNFNEILKLKTQAKTIKQNTHYKPQGNSAKEFLKSFNV
jgi:hypothetical protein